MAEMLYKGYAETRTESGTVKTPVLGIPLGRDSMTNKMIFAVSNMACNVFVPDTTIRVQPDYKPECIETADKNTCVIIGVVFIDQIYAFSGCCDKNGAKIFDNDIIIVEDKRYKVYFNENRLCWELAEVDLDFNRCGNAIALHRLKEQISKKAELLI